MTFINGHRGARNEAPENTIGSFIHAQKHGCYAFELDVRLSKDNQLVVFHDRILGRMTGVNGLLSSFTAEQLNNFDARGKILWPYVCPIPKLRHVIESVPLTKDWQFEVKPTSLIRMRMLATKLLQLIAEMHGQLGRVTITSSSEWFLKEIKRRAPSQNTGLVSESRGLEAVERCKRLGCSLLVINKLQCSETLVSESHKNGLEVSVWTVNNIEQMQKLVCMGVDSIITDVPSSAIQAISNELPAFNRW